MNSSTYIIALLLSFFVAILATGLVQFLARKLNILDKPDGVRKVHAQPTPLLGGVAIFLSLNLVMLIYAFFTRDLTGDTILLKNLIGISVGTLFLAIGGFLDDKYNLKPQWQIIWPVLAVLSVIACGIGIDWITNPFHEGLIYLDKYVIDLFWYHGWLYKITLLADLFTFVWLMGMMYTTKLLDGLDGLVSGITIIGGIFIFLTALNKGEIIQYDVALLAIMIVGVFAGFLVLNWHQAGIFLGEGGSTMAGFLLASLSIISGSKVGVTLMLMSIPVLDFLWTIIRRLMDGHSPFRSADKKHLHHRLLAAGFGVREAVLFLYAITILFGFLAYHFQELGWNILSVMMLVLIFFMLILAYLYKRQKERTQLD